MDGVCDIKFPVGADKTSTVEPKEVNTRLTNYHRRHWPQRLWPQVAGISVSSTVRDNPPDRAFHRRSRSVARASRPPQMPRPPGASPAPATQAPGPGCLVPVALAASVAGNQLTARSTDDIDLDQPGSGSTGQGRRGVATCRQGKPEYAAAASNVRFDP